MKTITGPTPDVPIHSRLTRATLNRLVGKALLDPTFRQGLLNGSRANLLEQHADELSNEDKETLMAVHADTLDEFARVLDNRFPSDEGGPGEPPSSQLLKYR